MPDATIADREQWLLAVLKYDMARDYDINIVNDPAFLVKHAGGFSPIGPVDEGEVFHVMPRRVVELGAHLSDEGFTTFCEAIRCWQRETLFEYVLRLAPELIVAKFRQDHPKEATVLLAVARHHDIEPVAFFGADHGRD